MGFGRGAMEWWDELEATLSAKLDDFLQANPDMAARLEQETLSEQEAQTRRLLQQLERDRQNLEQKIRNTAKDIRLWHERQLLAEQAKRPDLVAAARQRQETLMQQGKQYWAELQVNQKRRQQTETLLRQIQAKRQQSPTTIPKRKTASPDAVEREFQALEIEREFEKLKREMGR